MCGRRDGAGGGKALPLPFTGSAPALTRPRGRKGTRTVKTPMDRNGLPLTSPYACLGCRHSTSRDRAVMAGLRDGRDGVPVDRTTGGFYTLGLYAAQRGRTQ